MMHSMDIQKQDLREINHFTKLPHVWWGLKTIAGQKRYDNKFTKLLNLCQVKKGSKILEVGCGTGDFTKRLAKIKTSETKITAIDITPNLIKLAKKTIKNKKITFKTDSLHSLSFKNNFYDIVCGISILHHVSLKKALKEIYRVLKPGGEIFFTEPNLLNPVIYLGLNIELLREKMEFSPDETAFIRWSLEKEIKKAGFKNVKVLNYDFLHPNTPTSLIPFMDYVGSVAENMPLIKEFSGSLIIHAKK